MSTRLRLVCVSHIPFAYSEFESWTHNEEIPKPEYENPEIKNYLKLLFTDMTPAERDVMEFLRANETDLDALYETFGSIGLPILERTIS